MRNNRDTLKKLQAKVVAQIQADEDQKVFDILDAIASNCHNESHPGYGSPKHSCPHIDCVAETVHDS